MGKTYLGSAFLALAASIWGGMYVVSKVVLTVVPPLALVWLRYLVALAALGGIGLASGVSWGVRRKDVPLVAAIGVIGYAISIGAQFIGTKLSTAQLGSVVTSSTPAFMVVFAYVLLKEPLSWRKGLSVIMATIGVLTVVGLGSVDRSHQLGGLVLGLAALTWALMSVLVKRIPGDYSPLVVTTYGILVAAVVLTPVAVVQLRGVLLDELARPSIWGGVLYLGVVSTAGAFYLWNRGLQLVEAGAGGIYFFLQPIVGTLLGWLFLDERVTVSFWVGSGLVIAGVLLAVGGDSRVAPRAAAHGRHRAGSA